jgi:hypothetical protein
MFNATRGNQMTTYRVMLQYKIQSQVVYVNANSDEQAVSEALKLAPTAESAYVLSR